MDSFALLWVNAQPCKHKRSLDCSDLANIMTQLPHAIILCNKIIVADCALYLENSSLDLSTYLRFDLGTPCSSNNTTQSDGTDYTCELSL